MNPSVWALWALLSAAQGLERPDCRHGPLANNTVCNARASPADRAAALVQAMTTDEKLANLVNTSPGAPRIGLPPYEWWSEALHGVAGSPGVRFSALSGQNGSTPYSHATSFASPITLSAAFDDDLVERVATVISREARAFANAGRAGLDFWTPNINPYKDPRWGRGAETPGEDTTRIVGYVHALLQGLEGRQAPKSESRRRAPRILTTCKHFAAYDLERWKGTVRYGFDAVVSLQDLAEYYLPAFRQCARDSKVSSIMCSYNAVNGTPACANSYLMTDILRDHWGWTDENQYITSDCNAIKNFHHEHAFTKDGAESAALAYTAGTDTVCEVPNYEGTDVLGAFNRSLLTETVVDRALHRLYEGLVRVGYFDANSSFSSSSFSSLAWKDVDTPEARLLARQSAADGLVLLQNHNGTLPLALAGRSVALIGHWADATTQMLGGYSGIPPFYHNAVTAASAPGRNLSAVHVVGHAQGAPVNPPYPLPPTTRDTWTNSALEAARKADVVLYFGGTDLSIAAEDLDRTSIAWPPAQLALLTSLSGLGKPLVVVQLGDQVDDTPLLQNPNISAILWAGYPGQAGGDAVLDVLTGLHPPAGRLPVTQYPADYAEAVPMTDMALRPHTNAPGRTYRWYGEAVLPFGHGLHYTNFSASFSASPETASFSIADLCARCTHPHPDLCPFADISVAVTNTGTVASDFVALLFLAGSFGPPPFPRKTLVAYHRLRAVAPTNQTTASLPLTLGSLARHDAAGHLVLYPGTYTLLLDEPTQAQASFTLTGEPVVLDHFPQPSAK